MYKRIFSGISLLVIMIIGGVLINQDVNASAATTVSMDVTETEFLSSFYSYLSETNMAKKENIEVFDNRDNDEIASEYQSSEIFEIGDNVVITNAEIEQYETYYTLSGSNDPKQDALNYAEERNALYAAAIKNGFNVTETEVWNYLDELESILISSMSEEQYESMIQSFGSEDEYWTFEFNVYTVDLPIQNYVKSLENAYREESGITDDLEFERVWDEKFKQLKEQLVSEQNYMSIEDVY